MSIEPKFKVMGSAGPVVIGNDLSRPVGGTWGVRPAAISLVAEDYAPQDQLGRIAFHSQHTLGGTVLTNADGTARYSTANRLLTADQLHLIYQRTPDVRAGFDQIARIVSTWDWQIEVSGIDPDEEGYEEALESAAAIEAFLKAPNANDWTWQEVLVAWVTDLLKFDNGPVELCRGGDGLLEEIVPVRGGDIHEVLDEHGRLLRYKQVPTGSVGDFAGKEVSIDVEDMLLLQLFRSTEGPGGIPLLESLIHEVISVLRGAEYIATNLDLNEIPHGIFVVTGLAQDALNKFKAETEANRNRDWKMRIMASPGMAMGPVDAKWVQFQRAPRENQMAELLMEIRRTIWRVIGVMPVAMGDTESTPRATAEVQLDASHSHLIGPILELLQAKINSRIVPMLTPEELAGTLEFRFIMERDLTEAERDLRASRLDRLVKAGILSRNEAREELGYDPVANGDLLTVDAGQQSLVVLDDIGTEAEEEPDLLIDNPAEEVPDSPGSGEEESGDAEAKAASRRPRRMRNRRRIHKPRREARRARQRKLREIAQRRNRTICTPGLRPHVRGSENLPSEWQPGSKFEGHRALDLPKLGEQIAGYARDVLPLWEQARTAVISSIANHYLQDGFDAERRRQAVQETSDNLSKLMVDWAVATAPRYDAVALLARAATGNWISNPLSVERARELGSGYRDRAIAYLGQQEGPIHTIERRILDLLNQVSDLRSREARDNRIHFRGPRLTPSSAPAEVLRAVGEIFDAQRHRIDNWSGRLVELSYQVVNASLAEDVGDRSRGGLVQRGAATDWYVEWVSVHDKGTCRTCEREGKEPMRPVSHLSTMPGGATECRARCRCVLVYWTREEVEGGSAVRLGESAPVELDPSSPATALEPLLVPVTTPVVIDADDS